MSPWPNEEMTVYIKPAIPCCYANIKVHPIFGNPNSTLIDVQIGENKDGQIMKRNKFDNITIGDFDYKECIVKYNDVYYLAFCGEIDDKYFIIVLNGMNCILTLLAIIPVNEIK